MRRELRWAPLALLLLPGQAFAEPLDTFAFDALVAYVDCADLCAAGPELQRFACLDACGEVDPNWEKDGVAPVTQNDRWLAELEIAHQESGREICYRDEGHVVVPAALCPTALCQATRVCTPGDCALPTAERDPACLPSVCAALPSRDAADCADADMDGIPAWLEALRGQSDTDALTECGDDSACGFNGRCAYDPELGARDCQARDCGDAACTAFHLELVARDDQRALVQVWYDHSPVPARVLDLKLSYDRDALLLQDARPLPALTHFGKELAASHLSDGTLRLVIYDPDGREPIRTGPLVELVFQRTSDGATSVSFADSAALRVAAIAPEQEGVQDELAEDALWGAAVEVPAADDVRRDRLLLWYGFESPEAAESYRALPDGDALCARIPDCANEPDAVQRAAQLARLEALQRGQLASSERIDGVVRGGVWLDGAADHLRLPVSFQEPLEASGQSFSLALWFYSEGNGLAEQADSPQVVYAHVGPDERSRFGLLLDPEGDNAMTLSFFEGDLLDPETLRRTPLAPGIVLGTWHHAGFSLDAAQGIAKLYLDGVAVASHDFAGRTPPVACPGFANGSDLKLHEEGDFLSGAVPDVLYTTPRRSGVHRIERVDLNGQGAREVIADGRNSYRDVDVLPFLDRMVYASNASGSYEIWMARLDGSERQRLTDGFGDAARGITARRPRFAPDGTAIVFESNVYSIADAHNQIGRGYQLYFIGYDPAANAVAIELGDGGTAQRLDYASLVATQNIGAFQITRGPGNSTGAWWLRGRQEGGARGELLFDRSDERYDGRQIYGVVLPANLRDASAAPFGGLTGPGEQTRLLAAWRRVIPGATAREVSRVLFDRGSVSFEPAASFDLSAVEVGDEAIVSVAHTPGPQADRCWDSNRNHLPGVRDGRDPSEDRNGDGRWDGLDCLPFDVRNLYVAYDPEIWQPQLDAEAHVQAVVGGVLVPEDQGGVHKVLELAELQGSAGSFVRVEVLSPFNALPIPGGVVARLRFTRRAPGTPEIAFAPRSRNARSELYVDELTDVDPPARLALTAEIDAVEAATFSPDGQRLLLYGFSQGRPVLLRTVGLRTTSGAARVLPGAVSLRGFAWASEPRLFPCNWVGGYQHPSSRLMRWGLRGGLDELELHAGLRDPDAFASVAARGIEGLEVRDRLTPRPPLAASCSFDHAECPPFHLCIEQRCRQVECDPADPYSCAGSGGRCTLRPPSVEQENSGEAGFRWVCASDCAVDTQCFTQACQNGPCRFCDAGSLSCIECRDSVQDYGAFQIAGIEGCPDRNSFACEAGSCVTECYSFEDEASVYRCDPTLEYCSQGRCLLLDWDWADFAPASFGGLTETVYARLPSARRSTAIGEVSTVELKAYGVRDYLKAPELLVEAQLQDPDDGSALFGGQWFRLGKVRVYHHTRLEADAAPYTLHAPYPISDLRVRLINAPFGNLNAGASGLGALADAEFCRGDAAASGAAADSCVHRPTGSDFHVGYPIGLPAHTVADACREQGHAACPATDDPLRPFLAGGHAAAIVTEVTVNGASASVERNPVCSYAGGLDPVDAQSGRRNKLYFGDIAREASPEAEAFCRANPETCAEPSALVEFSARSGGAYALLNCSYNNEQEGGQTAMIDYRVPPFVQTFERGAVVEDASSCRVEIDPVRSELCYEWLGGDASVDPANGAVELFDVLEFSLSRGSHAHDRGFTSVPLPSAALTLDVRGLGGEGLRVSSGLDIIDVAGDGDIEVQFPTPLVQGRRFTVSIVAQPLGGASHYCTIPRPSAAMGENGATVQVLCGPVHPVPGRLSGLLGDRVVLRLHSDRHIDPTGRRRSGGSFDLSLNRNGDFVFPPYLEPGAGYSVEVVAQPRVPPQVCTVSGTAQVVAAQGNAALSVDCVELRPRVLSGIVEGLEGNGLELSNAATGERIELQADGEFSFRERVRPGEPYAVQVTRHPEDPVQSCTVIDGDGVMPNSDVDALRVSCTTLPLYYVGVDVIALRGRGLQLQLNGEEIVDVPADGHYRFETGLLDGSHYDVQVLTQPTTPAQQCDLAVNTGVIAGADFERVTVVCRVAQDDTSYSIGGRVDGLLGEGMRLSVGGGALRLFVDADGPFVFNQTVPPGFDYEVTVDTQPSNPTQHCSVSNASGRIRDADITNIRVQCQSAAGVILRMAASTSGLALKAELVGSDDAVPAAQSELDAVVPDTGGDVALVRAGDAAAASPARAALPAGRYTLYVWLNDDGSRDANDRAIFDAGESALRREIEITDLRDLIFELDIADFDPSVAAPVRAAAEGVAEDASLVCFWSHPAGQRIPLPPGAETTVLGRSVAACAPGETCFEVDLATPAQRAALTDTHIALPSGRYDLSCWVDRGGDGGGSNNQLDAGDLVGSRFDVPVDGAQITLTLEAP